MAILCIETSTSSAKSMLYENGAILRLVDCPYGQAANVITIDADGMFSCVIKSVKETLSGFSGTVEAVGLCGIWHSLLLLDKTMRPLGPISTWANGMADATAAEYRKDKAASLAYYKKTGCIVHSNYPLWQYRHLVRTGDSRIGHTAALSGQLEYLFFLLTGERVNSLNCASGSGMVDLASRRYDPVLLALADIDDTMLAPIEEPTYHAPLCDAAAKLLGLPTGVPVVCGGADGALNQIGSGATPPGIMTLSVGTSGALRVSCDAPNLPDTPSIWCYYLADGKYITGAATSGACSCLNWFVKDVLGGKLTYKELDATVDPLSHDGAPFFLPYNYGERCPYWTPDRTGGFFGLRGNPSKEQLYYAVLEGVTFNLKQCYTILTKAVGVPDEIRVSGGIIKAEPWLRLLADVFERPLLISPVQHASTLGAAALAMRAVGMIGALEEFQPGVGQTVENTAGRSVLLSNRYEKYLQYDMLQ